MPKKTVKKTKKAVPVSAGPIEQTAPVVCEHRTTTEQIEDGVKVLKCADCGLIIK